jgi:hypothetical protein
VFGLNSVIKLYIFTKQNIFISSYTFYCSFQNFLSSRLLCVNFKIQHTQNDSFATFCVVLNLVTLIKGWRLGAGW